MDCVFFVTFSCVCQIYVAEVLIIHFCNYYHLRFLSPYEYQSEVNGGSTLDLDPAPDPYVGCNFLTLISGPLHPQLQTHLSHLSSCGVGGWESTRDLDPAPDPYLGCNFLTLISGPLHPQLQSHLCLTLAHVEDQLQNQLQIHIWVVPF